MHERGLRGSRKLGIATGIWVLLVFLWKPLMVGWLNDDDSIGSGLYALFILLPYAIVLAALWIIKLMSFIWKRMKKG